MWKYFFKCEKRNWKSDVCAFIENNRPEEKLKTFPSRLSFLTSEFVSIILDCRQHCRSGGETFPLSRQEGHLGRFFPHRWLGRLAGGAELLCTFFLFQADSFYRPGHCISGSEIKIL